MLKGDNLVPNGKSQIGDNSSNEDNSKKQKTVVINENPETINDFIEEVDNKSEIIKKISRQERLHDDCNINSSVNGDIAPEPRNNLHDETSGKIETSETKTNRDSTPMRENLDVSVKQNGTRKIENNINNDFRSKIRDVGPVNSEASAKPSVVDERLAERRKSFVPMSSMEEENLRERLRLAQLRKCNEIISKDSRYVKENFRKLFQTEVSILSLILIFHLLFRERYNEDINKCAI